MGKKSKKGGNYEREICKDLSLWLSSDTNDKSNDDHFWRSAGSGARATVRSRKGKSTSGHAGDISPISQLGKKFISKIAMEIKRGYNKAQNVVIGDLFDHPQLKTQTLLEWVKQAKNSQKISKARHWMIIHKRDYREPIVYCDLELMNWIVSMYQLFDAKKNKIDKFPHGTVQLKKVQFGFFRLSQLLKRSVTTFKKVVINY